MKKKVAKHGLSVQFGTFPPKEDRVFPKGVSQGHVTAFDCSIKAKHVLFICVHIFFFKISVMSIGENVPKGKHEKKKNRFAILTNMKYYIVCYIHFIVQLCNCIVSFLLCYLL